ncbi:MAG: transporter ATP-binding protein [Sphaerisporangium sp.]|jgi:ABC-type lipoprotein export system ATPase subunit|nr:transporter ATP-binding protein [Sphaerisporangium sp.]
MTTPLIESVGELVRCVDVARTYGQGQDAVVAVHGVTCTVGEGDQIALTGSSGSGKTTLLHLLAGLDRPTTGKIHRGAATIGIVFQGPSLLPPLDVTENVALPLLIAGRDDAQARSEALLALEAVGIADLADRLPEELSGGQAQRVALARVLAAKPRLIIADEPTGQLDSVQADHVIDLLIGLASDLGAGLVVATHDRSIADRFPRRWDMRDGVVRSQT